MLIVLIGWAYVVLMMALAEATGPSGSVTGALVTLMLYGVLPLSIVLYIGGTRARWRARARAREAQRARADAGSGDAGSGDVDPGSGGEAAGDAVAPVGKEP